MMQQKDTFISVVAPVRNITAIVEAFCRAVVGILHQHYANYEVILIDDASGDDTASCVRRLLGELNCIRLVQLSRSFGKEAAISAGLEAAIGDFVVVMTPGVDPPELIPSFLEKSRDGYAIVIGIDVEAERGRGWWERTASRAFHAYCRRSMGIELYPGSTHFRVLSRQVVNAITQMPDRYRYLRLISVALGYPKSTFPYRSIASTAQNPDEKFWGRLGHAIDLIVTNSRAPLRLVSGLGLIASALDMLYVVYVAAIYLFKPNVAPGWTTLSLQTAGLFFLLFVILTVLCEYVGRILEETQQRPLYYVESESSSSVILRDEERPNIVRQSLPSDQP